LGRDEKDSDGQEKGETGATAKERGGELTKCNARIKNKGERKNREKRNSWRERDWTRLK